MFKWLFALFLCLAACSSGPKYRYNLAICAMFKNEAPWLKEWIVYHHDILGVEHFYLYNNDSSDDYKTVLQPFIDQGIVELIEWDSADETHRYPGIELPVSWYYYQIGAYNECLKKRALGLAKWVAVIDIDEFIVPVKGVRSFYAALKEAEGRKKGCMKFSWRMFGTSQVWDLAPGELLTEKLIYRGTDENFSHNWAKCMYRPEAIPFCHIHDAGTLIDGVYYPGKLKPPFRFKHAKPDAIRIHHYWSRTEKVCLEKRGTKEPYSEKGESYNLVRDETMHQYLPALKEAMTTY